MTAILKKSNHVLFLFKYIKKTQDNKTVNAYALILFSALGKEIS